MNKKYFIIFIIAVPLAAFAEVAEQINLDESASDPALFGGIVDAISGAATSAGRTITKAVDSAIEGGKSIIYGAKDIVRADAIAEGIYKDVGAMAGFETAAKKLIAGFAKSAKVTDPDDLGWALQSIAKVSGKNAQGAMIELTALAANAKKPVSAFIEDLKVMGKEKGIFGAMSEIQEMAVKANKTPTMLMNDLQVIGGEKGVFGAIEEITKALPVKGGSRTSSLVDFTGELAKIGGQKGVIGGMEELRSTAKSAGLDFNTFVSALDFNDRAKAVEDLRAIAKGAGFNDLPSFAAELKNWGFPASLSESTLDSLRSLAQSKGIPDLSALATELETGTAAQRLGPQAMESLGTLVKGAGLADLSGLAAELRKGGFAKSLDELGSITQKLNLNQRVQLTMADLAGQLKAFGGQGGISGAMTKLRELTPKAGTDVADLTVQLRAIGGGTNFADGMVQLESMAKKANMDLPELVATLKNVGTKTEKVATAGSAAIGDLVAGEAKIKKLASALTYQGVPDLVADLSKIPKGGVSQVVDDLLLVEKIQSQLPTSNVWSELVRIGGDKGITSAIAQIRQDKLLDSVGTLTSIDGSAALKVFENVKAAVPRPITWGQAATDAAKGVGGAVLNVGKKLLGWGS